MNEYDVQQVCVNGHQITDHFYTAPESRSSICQSCGASTIYVCQSCGTEIEGAISRNKPENISTLVPTHCKKCKEPFPWTKFPDSKEIKEGDSFEADYWQPRVMRHIKKNGDEEYAVHEVYFHRSGRVIGWTSDALSMRISSVKKLQEELVRLLERGKEEEIILGDRGYKYDKEDIRVWLDHIDQPVIDYQ